MEKEKKIPQTGDREKHVVDPKKAADERKAAEIGAIGLFGEMMSHEVATLTRDEYESSYPFLDRDEDYFDEETTTAIHAYEMRYDRETERLVDAAGSEADRIKAERDAKRSKDIEEAKREIVYHVANERVREISRRIEDMDRVKPKPGNVKEALRALDQLADEINKDLWDYRGPGEKIGKEWADYTLRILAEIGNQIKYEGSYTQRLRDDFFRAVEGRKDPNKETYQEARSGAWVESKWKNKMRALVPLVSGELFTETPQQELQRRLDKEKKLNEDLYKGR